MQLSYGSKKCSESEYGSQKVQDSGQPTAVATVTR